MIGGERFEAVIGEARRKNLNGQVLQALAVDQNGEPIDFFDAVVRDGNAADGRAVAVKEDVAAGILM